MANSYSDFLHDLGQRESGGNYSAENTFGYIGKYQMGEASLQDTGYVKPDGKPLNNDYSGGWTGKDGISSKKDFLNSPSVQDKAISEYHGQLWKQIVQRGLDKYVGTEVGGVTITESGLIAGAHLKGVGSLHKYFRKNGDGNFKDGYGTDIREYMRKFGGYDVAPIKNGVKSKTGSTDISS